MTANFVRDEVVYHSIIILSGRKELGKKRAGDSSDGGNAAELTISAYEAFLGVLSQYIDTVVKKYMK